MPTATTNPRTLRSTLGSDALWNVLGSLIYAGCQWGILVATVKLSSPADVGRLSLGFAITAPIYLLLHLRLRAASATDAGVVFSPASYVSLRSVSTALSLALCFIVCLATGMPHVSIVIVLWVAAAKAIESGSDLMYGFAQQADDMRSVAVSMTARGILAQIFFTVTLARTHRLDLALAGLCAAWLLVFVLIDIPRGMKRSAPIATVSATAAPADDGTPKTLLQLAILTLPLGLSTMFMSLMANMPRYFVEHLLGLKELGIFSAAAYLTMAISIIISAIAEASLAHLARCFAVGDTVQARSIIDRVQRITLLLSAAAIALSLLFGRWLLGLVYLKSYGDAAGLLTALMLVAAFANVASVYGYALVAARRFVRYLGALTLSAAVTAAACALLIPHWGTSGAAAACMLGYGVQMLSSWLALRPDLALQDNLALQAAPHSFSDASAPTAEDGVLTAAQI